MIKFGIIGTNFISDTFAEACVLSGVASPFAVLSRMAETGIAFAKKHNIKAENVYTDANLFANSGINAVYIASPNSLHCEQTLFFLEHSLPVLCEKPAAPCVADFEKMLAASRKNNVVLLEAMRQDHDPAMTVIKNSLSKLGKIRGASFEFCQYSSRFSKYLNGEKTNTFNPKFCNAALMDIGVYPINSLVYLFGEPKNAKGTSSFLENGFEASGCSVLEYDDFLADVRYSKVYQSMRPSAVFGEGGTLLIDKISVPGYAEIKYINGTEEILPVTRCENNLIYEIRDFEYLVSNNEINHRFNDITHSVIALMDKIRKSAGIEF